MAGIKIHVFHTGEVCVAPDLPFGGDNSNAIKASGVFGDRSERIWLAKGGIRAMMRGRVLNYHGAYTKCMSLMCRLVPRSVARKYAAGMNQ